MLGGRGPCSPGSGSHERRWSRPSSDPRVLPGPQGSRLGPSCREDKPSPVTACLCPSALRTTLGALIVESSCPPGPISTPATRPW